eukprot:gb/GECH01011385.1/.p1 GENE.gb/GECH01011385.1/~~gb/GECH01011385.1/.p1  ORF type:complete len:472 (+),score=82.99 gb/GECH01011385.1/:1-1416(+)
MSDSNDTSGEYSREDTRLINDKLAPGSDDGTPSNESTSSHLVVEGEEKKLSGSVGAFLNILKSNIGSGLLGMPYAFSLAGMWLSTLGISVNLVIAVHSIHLLLQAKNRLREEGRGQADSYGAIGREVFGWPGEVLVNMLLVFTQTGFGIAYLIFIAATLTKLFPMGPEIPYATQHIMWVAAAICVLMPIALLRSPKFLEPFALIGEITTIMALVPIYVVFIAVLVHNPDHFHSTFLEWRTSYFSNFPVFFGICVFSFEGIGVVIPVQDSMKRKDHYTTCLHAAMTVVLTALISFGLLGYGAFFLNTCDVVTANITASLGDSHVAIKIILQISLVLSLLFTYPIQLFPVIQIQEKVFENFVFTRIFQESSTKRYAFEVVARVALVLFTAFMAVVLSDLFGLFLSFIGALGGTTLAYILPSSFNLAIFRHEQNRWIVGKNIAILVFGIVGAVVATGTTVYQVIVPPEKPDVCT